MRDRAAAGLIAAAVSGAPSTAWALATGGDPLEAARAAGSIVSRRHPLAASVPVHLGISLFWASVIPRRAGVLGGALFGLAIAALDLGVLARHLPRLRALPLAPQLADHALFGAVAGAYLKRVRSCNPAPTSGVAEMQDLTPFREW